MEFGKVIVDRFAVDDYAFSAAARGLSTRHHQQCGWMSNSGSVCVWVECACAEPSKTATYLPAGIGNGGEPGRVAVSVRHDRSDRLGESEQVIRVNRAVEKDKPMLRQRRDKTSRHLLVLAVHAVPPPRVEHPDPTSSAIHHVYGQGKDQASDRVQ
jgi:hypothetical protein